jgi:hypothetical protein
LRIVAVIALALVLAVPASGGKPRRASLQLRSIDPVVVTGRGFASGEPVLLTARAGTTGRAVPLVAKRDGTFTARFRLHLGPCASLTVRAVGTRGSRAILKFDPDCPTPPRRTEGRNAEGPSKRAHVDRDRVLAYGPMNP